MPVYLRLKLLRENVKKCIISKRVIRICEKKLIGYCQKMKERKLNNICMVLYERESDKL